MLYVHVTFMSKKLYTLCFMLRHRLLHILANVTPLMQDTNHFVSANITFKQTPLCLKPAEFIGSKVGCGSFNLSITNRVKKFAIK